MNELTKIKDVSSLYNITTRTLRYYEKMGLIESSRDESSGYRLYDEAALIRLRQILILRKMNISIDDIGRIFSSKNSDTVLTVLDKKVSEIDDEMALLHELKEFVLEFIRQIRQVDFHNDADIKLLFDKATELETALVKDNRFLEQLFDISDVIDDQLTSVELIDKASDITPKTSLEKFEMVKMEARRFIGKTVYARAVFEYGEYDEDELPSGIIFGDLWRHKDWIFTKLDAISEYAADDAHDIGLTTWEKYDHNQLQGYWVGRFMKAETPVPKGLDYIDIPEIYVAKGAVKGTVNLVEKRRTGEFFIIINHGEVLVRREMERRGEYDYNGAFVAEVYTESPNNDGNIFGWEVWVSCRPHES
ncbi:MAG: MerR family transcriptional regulator [Clostridia bacterium]|nr:MerR family transcriptional regulator [Clostridia bacterium]